MRLPLRIACVVSLAGAAPAAAQARDVTCDTPVAAGKSPAIVPIYLYYNHIFVRLCGKGRELDFVLDSGAGETIMDMNLAKRLGIQLGERGRVGGIGAGSSDAALLHGVVFTVAGTGTRQAIPYAVDMSGMTSSYYHVLDGLLGGDFIANNVIAIDYEKQELRVYDRRTFRYQGPGTTLPLTLLNNKPYVDADIRLADGETLRGRFVVDLGSTMALALSGPFVDAHKLRDRVGGTVHPPGASGLGGTTTLVTGRVAGFKLGAIELPNTPVHLFGDSAGTLSRAGPIVGNIGGEVLRRFTVFFDYQSKVMILEPNSTKDWAR